MTVAILIAILLLCQIVLVSILFPRRLVNAFQDSMPDQFDLNESRRKELKKYLLLNYGIATLGLACLAICATFYFGGLLSVTGLLLAIGVVFLAQMSPLAAFFFRDISFEQDFHERESDLEFDQSMPKLLELLPTLPVVIASGLFFAYVAMIGMLWIRTGVNQFPKLVSITFTNLVCASAVLWAYRRLLREEDDRMDRYKELVRMGPILVFASILVSIYFFAKEVLFAFDLQEARPMMMSVALQLVAATVFGTVTELSRNRTKA